LIILQKKLHLNIIYDKNHCSSILKEGNLQFFAAKNY